MVRVKRKLTWWIKLIRYSGRTLAILWAVFWGLFVWVQIIFDGAPWSVVLIFSAYTAVTLAGVVFLWLFELIGSIILFAEGLFLLITQYILAEGVPGASDIPLFMMLVMPLIAAGILGFLSWWFARKAPPKEK